MFGKIGMGEVLIIFAVILLIFGPTKLPALAKSMGQAIKEFKKGTKEVQDKVEEFIDEPVADSKDEPKKETTAKEKK